MSIINRLGGAFTKNPSVREAAQKTAQKAKMYFNTRTGEHLANGIKKIHSPATDAFIDSVAKQNATIVGDVMSSTGKRYITAQLPSGTTVCKVFDQEGLYRGKEVITSNSRSVYSRNMSDPKLSNFYFESNNGASIYGRAGDVYRNIAPVDYGRMSPSLAGLDGITAKVNQ